jgi:hypothetical protein
MHLKIFLNSPTIIIKEDLLYYIVLPEHSKKQKGAWSEDVKKSELLREIAAYVPLDRLFIETDTPYLAPESKRGKSNEPAYIDETARALAQIKNISVEEIGEATAKNIAQFFSFPKRILSV